MKRYIIIIAIFIVVVDIIGYYLISIEGVLLRDLNKQRMLDSPNFIDGKAQNLESTQQITIKRKTSMLKTMYELFITPKRPDSIPRAKDDLKSQMDFDFIVWFGHSSYLFQLDGVRFIIDPVLNESASPIGFINKPFNNTQFFMSDLPNIDYLIITHNHYDHLSKKSIKALNNHIKNAFVPLGVGKYLKAWGISEDKIIELDWNESVKIADGASQITALSARHFSGRGLFDRNKSLWASFMLQTKHHTIYIGGDSGYGAHFKEIGSRFDIDLALLENGQYSQNWAFVHMFPAQTLEAARDLRAKYLMPVHNSKFKISYHDWDEPLRDLYALYTQGDYDFALLTPLIGQIVPLWEEREFAQWWE